MFRDITSSTKPFKHQKPTPLSYVISMRGKRACLCTTARQVPCCPIPTWDEARMAPDTMLPRIRSRTTSDAIRSARRAHDGCRGLPVPGARIPFLPFPSRPEGGRTSPIRDPIDVANRVPTAFRPPSQRSPLPILLLPDLLLRCSLAAPTSVPIRAPKGSHGRSAAHPVESDRIKSVPNGLFARPMRRHGGKRKVHLGRSPASLADYPIHGIPWPECESGTLAERINWFLAQASSAGIPPCRIDPCRT